MCGSEGNMCGGEGEVFDIDVLFVCHLLCLSPVSTYLTNPSPAQRIHKPTAQQ